ncbi:MAG: hypothetical protein H6797_00715 [Candidatus Nomurabacteria bacterium]|nr:MAG: hypothetical protein H6797_00715 [Candidatus Nomurabacteria bacterium]
MTTVWHVIFTILLFDLVVVLALCAATYSRGEWGKHLTANERSWTIASLIYWCVVSVAFIVYLYAASYTYESVLGIALGVGILFTLFLPESEVYSIFSRPLIRVVFFALGVLSIAFCALDLT